ncbi:MAG: type VI secretion protein [Gammaproteobacteria bacterium]|nr:type VI secretion protein [Gammaproteobacteria bacterium]MBU1557082.1 type VI secretion protein [Gammaproteobacteria bacterium]MBU2070867.1 type VI secretion protein [Gammaproteobacteria bacterium]MBU2185040.1 type VI secretion protein [Gammaproteobacteria bacterium]MBU2204073.1 type VI secretion protein [Gammaproteobacteria bacterium]
MNKLIVIIAALSCCFKVAAAAIPLEQALELCRAEQNALRRLTCYDAIADGKTVTKPTAAQATAPQSPAAQQAVNSSPAAEQFGIEHHQLNDADNEQLQVVVKSLRYNPHKELTVEFANGQIWQQVGNDYYKIAEGETHFIRRAAFDSFLLGNDKSSRTVRVKRVK